MEKKVRIERMLDKDSYLCCLAFYKHVKTNKTYYTLNDLVLLKSILRRIIVAQSETEEMEIDGRIKIVNSWARLSVYFQNIGYMSIGTKPTHKQVKRLFKMFEPHYDMPEYKCPYNYTKEDYGKLL